MMQFYDDRMLSPNGAALDLAIPKPGSTSPGVIEPTVPVIPAFMFNPVLNRVSNFLQNKYTIHIFIHENIRNKY